MLTVAVTPAFRSASLRFGLVQVGEVAEVLDDLLDPLEALARPVQQTVQIGLDERQIDLLAQLADPLEQVVLVRGQGCFRLLVEPEDVVQVGHLALEHVMLLVTKARGLLIS